MIITTIVPHNYLMPMDTVKSFLGLQGYTFNIQEGPSLPANRNKAVDFAKLTGKDLLFIDSDIVFTPEDVAKMEEHLKTHDVVTGIYAVGGGLRSPCLYKRFGKGYVKTPIPDTFSEIGACGGGFLGISAKALKVVGDEPFNYVWEEGEKHSEDISFCHRVHESGLKLWVDPTILLGHIRSEIFYP